MTKTLTWLWVFLSLSTYAQTSQLTGTVTDENDEELIGATIAISDLNTGATTDVNGNYTLNIEPGSYKVECTYIGYRIGSKNVKIEEGENVILDFKLSPSPQNLEVTVVTSSRFSSSISDQVVSMSVISPQIIQNNNARMNEAINKVPGVTFLGENISIRGGGTFASGANSRTVMLLDGLPLVGADNGGIKWEALPTESIHQVEVVKGASSALYGSSALNGVINIRTSDAYQYQAHNKLRLHYGWYGDPSNEKYNHWWDDQNHRPIVAGGSFLHQKRHSKVDVSLGVNYLKDNHYLSTNDKQRIRLHSKLRHISKRISGLTVGLNSNMMYEEGGTFFLWSDTGRGIFIPRDSTQFRERLINFDPYVTWFTRNGDRHSLNTRIFDRESTNFGPEYSHSTQYYGQYTYQNNRWWYNFNVTTGISGFYTNINSRTFGDLNGVNLAGFIQTEKRFNRLNISAGLRLEHQRNDTVTLKSDLPLLSEIFRDSAQGNFSSGIVPVGRLGLSYNLGRATFLRASIGQGFRFPTAAEMFTQVRRSGVLVVPNVKLLPESGWSVEFGVKQQFQLGSWMGYVDAAAFYTKYRNMIEFAFRTSVGPPFVFVQAQNVSNAKISGLEFTVFSKGELGRIPLAMNIGYTYINPIDLDTDTILKYRNKHSFKLTANSSYGRLFYGTTIVYNSHTLLIDDVLAAGIRGIYAYRAMNNKGHFVWDARIGLRLNDDFDVSLIAKNILNKDYTTRPGYIEPPRNFSILAQYEF